MMDTLIERFPAQLKEAIEIGEAASINPHDKPINKIFIAGMGGSGIGGNFVQDFVYGECKIPIIVGKRYQIPAFVDENTLAIISSYSGNTEETYAAFEAILKTGAKVVCIASGGKIIAKADELGLDKIEVPGTWPSPRACLGYSVIEQLFVLYKLDIISKTVIDQIKSSIDLIKYDQDEIKKKAQEIADEIYGKTAVIYTTDRMESVAVRFRQQINENAKLLCWHHVIPEMNHNELVGWKDERNDLAVVFFRNRDDFKRNDIRIDINKKIIGKYVNTMIDLYSKGQSEVEKSIYFVHLGDWITWYLSVHHKVDSIEVDAINYLKGELAKV